jgi:hypothetical protein
MKKQWPTCNSARISIDRTCSALACTQFALGSDHSAGGGLEGAAGYMADPKLRGRLIGAWGGLVLVRYTPCHLIGRISSESRLRNAVSLRGTRSLRRIGRSGNKRPSVGKNSFAWPNLKSPRNRRNANTQGRSQRDRGGAAMVTPDFIEKLKQVLETRGVRRADMSYVVASLWTQDQVPEIQNEDQYQEYLTLWHRLNAAAGLPRAENFTRSRDGIYLDSVGARLIDWEEKAPAAPAEQENRGDLTNRSCGHGSGR